ncbi:MAG: glycosyltransferase [Lachnospiraceae bacterium]|nr:glycosyltransferase [Lachnospiraceae bacterium]
MDIATIIFTYNRSSHTEKVLNSLKSNTVLPEKLFIFQDGLSRAQDRDEWERVNNLINNIEWCETKVIVSDSNKGLADSIVDGVSWILEKYSAAVILEDDCVVHPQFMEYMILSLLKYAEERKVYCINGYGWPVDIAQNGTDAYFIGRIGTWGWGTWKDRWADYERDYRMLSRIKKDTRSAERLRIWGGDLENVLMGNVKGTFDSWAVFWALMVIEKDGYCLTPYHSFVDNIGFDGTGVHSGAEKPLQALRSLNDRKEISLPDVIEFPVDHEEAYSDLFLSTSREDRLECYDQILIKWIEYIRGGHSIADLIKKKDIHKIAIWGKGRLCDLLLDGSNGVIDVLAIVETNPKGGLYRDIPVVSSKDIPVEADAVIVIPVYDIKKIEKKIRGKSTCKVIGLDQLFED